MNIQYAAVRAWRQSKDTVQCSAILMRYRMHLTVSDVICMCYCSNVRRTYKTNTSSYTTGNKLSSKQKGSYCNGQNDDCWAKAEDGRSRMAEAACTARVPLHRGSYALATSCDCCQAPDDKTIIPPPPHITTVLRPISGTTQVSWCQNRTSGLYDARED